LQQVQAVGFLPGRFEALEAHEFSQVEERAGHCGHRDPSANGPILRVKSTAMNPDLFPATNALTTGRRCYVDD